MGLCASEMCTRNVERPRAFVQRSLFIRIVELADANERAHTHTARSARHAMHSN